MTVGRWLAESALESAVVEVEAFNYGRSGRGI